MDNPQRRIVELTDQVTEALGDPSMRGDVMQAVVLLLAVEPADHYRLLCAGLSMSDRFALSTLRERVNGLSEAVAALERLTEYAEAREARGVRRRRRRRAGVELPVPAVTA